MSDLSAKSRKREYVQARQLAMYFAKKYTKASLSAIGAEIGGKDHSTVLHANKQIDILLESDKLIKNFVDDLNKKILFQNN